MRQRMNSRNLPRQNRLALLGLQRYQNLRKIKKGLIYIQTSSNNTIITVTDLEGQVLFWDSATTSSLICLGGEILWL